MLLMNPSRDIMVEITGKYIMVDEYAGKYMLYTAPAPNLEQNIILGVYETKDEAMRALAYIAECADKDQKIVYIC